MSIYAIADLHLSFNTDKPMDIFGPNWENHAEKIKQDWLEKVNEQDTVLIPGDFSWETYLEDTYKDFEFLNSLPGRKILLKGNHDYWWSTSAKFYKFCNQNNFSNQWIMNNNCYEYNGYALCGTRGWFFEEERGSTHDEKIFKRELLRLEASLRSAGELPKLVFLHYPPQYRGYECKEILDLLKAYDVRQCYYGHLHGASHALAMEGQWDGIDYTLVSADRLNFKPYKIF